ncbi:hypothetical protein [Glycomyces paridis]|uniref:Uncharacterized protein n=1 Tax=Glycomyces paridis TaxID=2126555 RepID=A0A4S8P6T4_9ACTN|nr:hypothetical protein [Glycomyces paridis]THV25978.1 hypothetical protein E9998_19790 [Glycomyces paridis]
MRSTVRASVALCTACGRDDRHWLVSCSECPKDRFHCRNLPDAHSIGTLHVTHQHRTAVAQ